MSVENSGRVEINSSVTGILRLVHGVIYVIFYGRIRIPRISGNFGACADSVYQALLSAHEREPGFKARFKAKLSILKLNSVCACFGCMPVCYLP